MNKLDAVISLDNHIMRMYTMAWGISDKDFASHIEEAIDHFNEEISNYSEINIKLTLREAHFLLAAIKENRDYYIKEHELEQVKDKLEEALK